MKFKLEIVLGNEAMQTGDDVAAALESAARQLRSYWGGHPLKSAHGESPRSISDGNGNRVGNYKLTK